MPPFNCVFDSWRQFMSHDRWVVSYRGSRRVRLELRPANALAEQVAQARPPIVSLGELTATQLAKKATEEGVPPFLSS